MDTVAPGVIDWGVAAQAFSGQGESGDHFWVKVGCQEARVAAVDGLGHGEEAVVATRIAIATLEKCRDDSPLTLIRRCHEALRSTRGVVMSLASFSAHDNTMTWLGVGNVEGVLLRRDIRVVPGQEVLLPRPGVVGDFLPRLSAHVIPVAAGDLLIFATDGIRAGFPDKTNLRDPPQQTADRILAQYGRGTDDALVLVAQYRNGQNGVTKR